MEDSSSTAPKELHCYIHAMSPVKKASSSNRKYFDCTLQNKDNSVKAVCFSPEKYAKLNTLQQTKSPVKITNYNTSANNGKEDIILLSKTRITPITSNDIDFHYSGKLTAATGILPNLLALEKLAAEQLVTIKAQVAQMSAAKTLRTQHQGVLKKQELLIRDTTTSVKLLLWENNVDMLELNKTYILQNIKLKRSKNDIYLNTTKADKFTFSETTAFTAPLIAVEDDVKTTSTITARVLGIHQAFQTLACVSCHRKVIPIPDDDILGQCEGCKLTQAINLCESNWYLRALAQNTAAINEKFRLGFNQEHVAKLMEILQPSFNLQTAKEKDILKAILINTNKLFTLTFDTVDYKVTDLEIK